MLLSKLLDEMNIVYTINNEREFKNLALIDSVDIDSKCVYIAKYADLSNRCNGIEMIITTPELGERYSCFKDVGFCYVTNPRLIFFRLHNYLCSKKFYIQKDFKTKIGKNCIISPQSHINGNNVIIGDNVRIEEFSSIQSNCVIGNNCVLRSGCIVGTIGYEYKQDNDGYFAIEHVGQTIIEDNVTIGYNSCIDKSIYPWDKTVIGKGTKIDTLCKISHGCKIGENCLISTNTAVSGRVLIGNNVWIGPGCTIRNNIKIKNNVRINLGSVLCNDANEGDNLSGFYAIEHNKFVYNQMIANIKNRGK